MALNQCVLLLNTLFSPLFRITCMPVAGCGGLKGLLVVQGAGSTHEPVGGRPKVDAYPDCDWLHVWKADLW